MYDKSGDFMQQGTVVQGEIASESRCRHFADTADFRTGQPGRAIQFDCLTVFFFCLRLNPAGAVCVLFVIGKVHKNTSFGCMMRYETSKPTLFGNRKLACLFVSVTLLRYGVYWFLENLLTTENQCDNQLPTLIARILCFVPRSSNVESG